MHSLEGAKIKFEGMEAVEVSQDDFLEGESIISMGEIWVENLRERRRRRRRAPKHEKTTPGIIRFCLAVSIADNASIHPYLF